MSNQERLWFRNKLYGWGWYPVTWEGWLAILAFVGYITILITAFALYLTTPGGIVLFLGGTLAGVLLLLAVCVMKGEKPVWRWGIKK